MIKKIAIYLFLFLGLLFSYRAFLYEGMRENKLGIFDKYNTLFLKEGNTYNALFMGSSRAEMHFHPGLFDSITGLHSFNMGISGASPRISYALLKTYCLRHPTPKFIIFNLDYFSLQNDTDRLNDFPRYFPYLENRPLRDELYQLDDRFHSFYYNPLHSIPYTQVDYLSASLHGWLSIYGRYDTLMYKGFQTTESNEVHHLDSLKPVYAFISSKNRTYLDSLVYYSKAHHIQLIWVTSPVYGGGWNNVINRTSLSKQLSTIAYLNHIPYMDYSDSLFCRNPLLFADHYHLNLRGARAFSQSFSLAFHNIFGQKPLFNK